MGKLQTMKKYASILPTEWQHAKIYCLDLSAESSEFADIDPTNTAALTERTQMLLKKNNATLAIGRYNEVRAIYQQHQQFSNRVVHLGIDLTLPAGTEIYAPCDAYVHSFADNKASGDYGPTVILTHNTGQATWHTLYGHLSKDTLLHLKKQQFIARGECVGRIGTAKENGGWPPHLHFQVIHDMGDYEGDYPGVCSMAERADYLKNCPDPNLVLNLLQLPRHR